MAVGNDNDATLPGVIRGYDPSTGQFVPIGLEQTLVDPNNNSQRYGYLSVPGTKNYINQNHIDIASIGGAQVGITNPLSVQQQIASASQNGTAFSANTGKLTAPAIGTFPLCVFNPITSTKTLLVYSVKVSTASASINQVNVVAADPAFATPVVAQNNKSGAAASVTNCTTTNVVGSSPLGTMVDVINDPTPGEALTNGDIRVITPGNGIVVWFQSSGTPTYSMEIKWFEQYGNFNVTSTLAVSYGPNGAQLMDIFQAKGMTTAQPCIMFIHGGGYSGGSQTSYDPICAQYCAALGYTCVTVAYRLSGVATWPAQINDCQLAVRFLRQNAATYNIDVNNICAAGDSVGGHFALLCTMLATIHSGDMSAQLPAVNPQTTCCIDLFGPADLTLMYNNAPTALQTLLSNEFGGTPVTVPAVYADTSPVLNIPTTTTATAAMGPVLIIQGTNDLTVPAIQSQNLFRALQAKGYYPTYIPYLGDHEFSNSLINGLTLYQGLIFQFLQTYMPHN